MNADARAVVEWTRSRLGPAELGFPRRPAADRRGGRPPLRPRERLGAGAVGVHHVRRSTPAGACARPAAALTFCGHMHTPALYHMAADGRASAFDARSRNAGIPLGPHTALARDPRLRRAVARRQPGRMLCDLRRRHRRPDLPPRPLRRPRPPLRKIREAGLPLSFNARLGRGALSRACAGRDGPAAVHRRVPPGGEDPPGKHGRDLARSPRRLAGAAGDEDPVVSATATIRRPSWASRSSR